MSAVLESPPDLLTDLVQRVRGEYLEMPGLRLTSAQAQRLWHLDRAQCETVFSALIDARILRRTPDGSFVRNTGQV